MSDGLSLPSIRETRPVRPSLFKSESTEILVDNVGGLLEQSRADKDIADVREEFALLSQSHPSWARAQTFKRLLR